MVGQHLLAYGPSTALLVVDVQNDFADPSGALYVPSGGVVVDKANAEVAAARAPAQVATPRTGTPRPRPLRHRRRPVAVHRAAGAAFHADLVLAGEVVQKGTGARTATGVRRPPSRTGDEHPTRLVTIPAAPASCGGDRRKATDYCARQRISDALRHGFPLSSHRGHPASTSSRATATALERAPRRRPLGDGAPWLYTDLYELTMAASFHRERRTETVTFTLRPGPPPRRKVPVVAGSGAVERLGAHRDDQAVAHHHTGPFDDDFLGWSRFRLPARRAICLASWPSPASRS